MIENRTKKLFLTKKVLQNKQSITVVFNIMICFFTNQIKKRIQPQKEESFYLQESCSENSCSGRGTCLPKSGTDFLQSFCTCKKGIFNNISRFIQKWLPFYITYIELFIWTISFIVWKLYLRVRRSKMWRTRRWPVVWLQSEK